jgi:signal transduction histidine kinase/ActR/RegA family two-component response regulator
MVRKTSTQSRKPVLVCTARKEDIAVLETILAGQSADAAVCPDVSDLCRRISDQVEAALISSEMLTQTGPNQVTEALDAQPEWSDLPVILLVEGGADSPAVVEAIPSLGNVLVLEYPFTPAALKYTLLVAFRSRERQRWVRDLTVECEHAVNALQESRGELERRVQERTSELAEKTAQMRHLTGELILSEQKERRRMARILHDHLQQLLVSAKYRVGSLSRTDEPAVRTAAQEVDELLSEVIEVTRSMTSELNPPIVHEGGLRSGLEWLVNFMAAQSGLSVQLNMKEDFRDLDDNLKILSFEATRELLSNSVRHGKAQSAKVMANRAEGNMLEILVTDQGIGFDPALLKKNEFGLFRIQNRLELIGGKLEIESAPGRGARFRILAPLREIPTAPAPQSGVVVPRSEKPVSSMIRILIADDHAVMRQGLSTSLGQEPDIAIVGEAADGKSALEKARKLHPDIVLMDLGMPKMSGLEATRLIHSEMPQVRVIGLSMFDEKERANAMFEAGAVAYLSKSCSVDALTSTIRRCVGKPELPVGER